MTRQTTRSYAGRQLDIEVLSHVEKMLPRQKVSVISHDTPRIVAGIQKAVQRHVKLFFTTLNTMKFEPGRGGTLFREIARGRVNDIMTLEALCGSANAEALSMLRRDDGDTTTFGEIPDDERLTDASVTNLALDRTTQTIKIELTYVTAAGDNYKFVVPITSI